MPQDNSLKFYKPGATPVPSLTIPAPPKKDESPFYVDLQENPYQQKQPDVNSFLQAKLASDALSFVKPAISSLGWVADQLSRGQYASAKFFNSTTNENKSILNSLGDAWLEFKKPTDKLEKLSFADVIRKSRKAKGLDDGGHLIDELGFVLDLALDPFSYVGIGLAGKGISVGEKTLTKYGAKFFKESLKAVQEEKRFVNKTNIDVLERLAREGERSAKGLAPDALSKDLEKIGYYEHLENKIKSIKTLINDNGIKLPDEQIEELAKNEVIKDIKDQQKLALNLKYADNPEANSTLTTFTTSKGSTYTVNKGNKTTRNKSYHPEHGIEDQGIQPKSNRTFYVDKNDVNKLDIVQTKGGFKTTIDFIDDNNAAVKFVTGPNAGKFIKDTNVVIKDTPEVGLIPVELFNKDRIHFGNEIIEVTKPGKINLKLLQQTDRFTPDKIYQTTEERIADIVTMHPAASELFFKKDGLRLTVGLPFGSQYDLPGSQALLKALKLDYLQNSIRAIGKEIGATKVGGAIGRTFVKEFDPKGEVPKEWWDEWHNLANTFDENVNNVIRTTSALKKDVTEERQKVLGELGLKIRDLTRAKELELAEEGKTITAARVARIRTDAIKSANLSANEQALFAAYYQDFAKMAEIEKRAGILSESINNYFPRKKVYDLISDAPEFTELVRTKLSPKLTSSLRAKYETLAEFEAAGNVPELNAAILYAQRLLSHREKVAVANFNKATRTIFGFPEGVGPLTAQQINTLPEVVKLNLKMLGDSVYPAHISQDFDLFVKGVDAFNRVLKRTAYSLKPASAIRQGIQNPIQSAMVQGIKAFKAFDPRAVGEIGLLLLSKSKYTNKLPAYIENTFGKYLANSDAVFAAKLALDKVAGYDRLNDFVKGYKKVNPFGVEYDGEFLRKFMQEQGVIKGFDPSGEAIKVKVERALKYNNDSIASVAGELARFWNWPSLVEDFGRGMNFLTGISLGHSPQDSLKILNKTLFDYSRGLSYAEKTIFKRVILFYTYPRFAIPFVLKNTLSKPGNAITGEKAMRLLEKLIVSQDSELTSNERESIPGYLLEQPRLYRGMDKDGKANFNILNNLTPLDALNLLQFDSKGNLDIRRSVEHTAFAAIVPYLKVPLGEAIQNKNFFTGQALDRAGKLGNVERTLGMVMPEPIKDMIGWENRIDPQTGRETVYINPFLAHTAISFVPAVKDWVLDPLDQDKTAFEKTMDFFLGITTQKVDLLESAQRKQIGWKAEINRLKGKIFSAQRRGSVSEAAKAEKELQDFLDVLSTSNTALDDIRGKGLSQQETQDIQLPKAQ